MFDLRASLAIGAALVAVPIGGGAHATAVSVSDPFIQLDNSGPNDIKAFTGFSLFIGAGVVTPAGMSTTATISTTDTITGQAILRSLPFVGTTADPGAYNTEVPDNPGLHGGWTLKFTNGTDVTTEMVNLPAGATQLPPITNLSIGGSSSNPTFAWLPPAGRAIEGYRINLIDLSLTKKTGRGADTVLTTTITSPTFTVPTNLAEGLTLDPSHRYTMQVNALENRDGSGNLSNANVVARSRAYFDFTPASVGGPGFTYLPVHDPITGIFSYDVTNIAAGTTIFVDPEVAVGYDYAIGAGNPDFRTVVLPTGIGDGKYDIYGFDVSGNRVPLAMDWLGGDIFDFGATGVNRFEVLGIDPAAGLDPTDTTAFVTGLSFVSSGDFTGTQTPITADIGVPEPSTAMTFAVGLLGLFQMRRQR